MVPVQAVGFRYTARLNGMKHLETIKLQLLTFHGNFFSRSQLMGQKYKEKLIKSTNVISNVSKLYRTDEASLLIVIDVRGDVKILHSRMTKTCLDT